MPIEADLPIRSSSHLSMQTTDINVQPDILLDKDSQPLKAADSSSLGGEAVQTGETEVEADGITTREVPVAVDGVSSATTAQNPLDGSTQPDAASPPAVVASFAPPPAIKRFSSATISKQFMQKNTSATGNQSAHNQNGSSQSNKPSITQLGEL